MTNRNKILRKGDMMRKLFLLILLLLPIFVEAEVRMFQQICRVTGVQQVTQFASSSYILLQREGEARRALEAQGWIFSLARNNYFGHLQPKQPEITHVSGPETTEPLFMSTKRFAFPHMDFRLVCMRTGLVTMQTAHIVRRP